MLSSAPTPEDEIVNEKVGLFLREARERAGISQVRFAELAGVKQATVSRIERGKQYVTIAMIVSYMRILKLRITLISEPAATPPIKKYTLTL
jgi:transcriptional regulator with XRE-family HTH domain